MKDVYAYANTMCQIPPVSSADKKAIGSLKEREAMKSLMRSCIITRKGGMPTIEIQDEYKKCTGEDAPYLKLGYFSFFHLIRDMPDVVQQKNSLGQSVLIVKPNQKTEHLQQMISKQKDPKVYTDKEPKRRERTFRERKNRQAIFERRRRMFNSWSSSISSSNSSSSSSSSSGEEKVPPTEENHIPHIFTAPNIDKSICIEPILGRSQLVGDDFFLQLSIKYLPLAMERQSPKSAITIGMVQSGMTIRKAISRLDNIDVLSNKLIINLGTVDVYNRRTSDQMVRDYKQLLNKLKDKFGLSNRAITLCTIPPLGNINFRGQLDQYVNYTTFNNWLRNLAKDENYKLIDFFEEFSTTDMSMNYDLFQTNARMVSGTPHPHLLWNYYGRQKAMKLLLNA